MENKLRKFKKKTPHKKYRSLFFLKSYLIFNKRFEFWKKVFSYKKSYILNISKNFFSFYSFYTRIKKKKLRKLINFTIKKASRKRTKYFQFLPEQRLDVFLARFFKKNIDHARTDIIQGIAKVNGKKVSPHYILVDKDFIKIWRVKGLRWRYFRRQKIKRKRRMFLKKVASPFIVFEKLMAIIFLKSNYKKRPRNNVFRINQPWVKKAHIWQVKQLKYAQDLVPLIVSDFSVFLKK